jgi:hypothetical protein
VTKPIFPLSDRPDVVVDPFSTQPFDGATQTALGYPGPLGRERLVYALPTMDPNGPQCLEPPELVGDQQGFAIGAPDGTALGQPGMVVHRLLTASPTASTRRF